VSLEQTVAVAVADNAHDNDNDNDNEGESGGMGPWGSARHRFSWRPLFYAASARRTASTLLRIFSNELCVHEKG
jgi:hypothetical protein